MPEATTASFLTRYHAELVKGGLDRDLANDIVRDAAHALVDATGLTVEPSSTLEVSA